jgi:hypothetical protein
MTRLRVADFGFRIAILLVIVGQFTKLSYSLLIPPAYADTTPARAANPRALAQATAAPTLAPYVFPTPIFIPTYIFPTDTPARVRPPKTTTPVPVELTETPVPTESPTPTRSKTPAPTRTPLPTPLPPPSIKLGALIIDARLIGELAFGALALALLFGAFALGVDAFNLYLRRRNE